MNLSSCSSVLDLLPWFVGDDLDATSSEAVRAHLRDCSSCRREAAALLQSTKALQTVGADMAPVSGSKAADEPMFAAMHDSIVQAVRTEAARLESAPRSAFATRWMSLGLPLAAAVMLFAAGWWWVRESSSLQLLQRRPIDMPPVAEGTVEDASVRVVPWAGPRVPLQLLGFEAPPSGAGESGIGQGMMGRGRLRDGLGGAPIPPLPR